MKHSNFSKPDLFKGEFLNRIPANQNYCGRCYAKELSFIVLKGTFLFLFFLLSLPVISQEMVSDSVALKEVVVTGSKRYRSAGNVTQKIDVLKTRDLENAVSGNNNIAEVLRGKPGVSVSALSRNDANWGTYAGIGPKYSTYMLNGLPVDAFIDPMALDLMAVERIEIQRGPASVLYPGYLSQDFAGNQSPLAGTVNLILKENFEDEKAVFKSSYGSYNTFNTQTYYQNGNDNLNYFGGVNYEKSDYTNYGTSDSWLNMQKDPEYEKFKIFGGANFLFGENDDHQLSVFINKTWHNGDAGRVYRGFAHEYTTVNIAQSSKLSENFTFNASAGMRLYDRSWQESNFNMVDSLVSENGANQRILPFDVNFTLGHGEAHLLTFGADYQNASYNTTSNPVNGYEQYGNKFRATQAGVYLQEELNFGDLTLRGGLRYNSLNTQIDLFAGSNPGEPEIAYHRFLWSAGLKYHLSTAVSLFANGGNSFMAPGLKSMGGTLDPEDRNEPGKHGQLPNPDLDPELGRAFDLGGNVSIGNNLFLDLRAFYISVDDAIIDIRVSENPSQSQSINAGGTRSSGFELEFRQELSPGFSWFANATSMETRISNDRDDDQDGASVPFAPELVGNAGILLTTDFGLTLRPVLNYTGAYYDSSSKSGRNEFEPGVVINFFGSQRLAEEKAYAIDLFTEVYNLTDNRFEMPWQFKNTGIAISGGFKVTFN
ncbi:TonB-dependent receptor plug domain-containing protein [Marinilabilia rubra]|uniref:TonB-dependent receptor n=1 Tax=Marinilabilia rubra TaxID=2162893 RepID=A0A2U2B7M0_9BACT|nr:TonB-dependent receptor [Marinilabilia rubra]PWD99058.1 TonB-dependent receptor [Marinilabilia rubra]